MQSFPAPHPINSRNELDGALNPDSTSTALGPSLVNNATRALGWSFLATLLSGKSKKSGVREAVKLFMLGSLVESGRRFCYWAFERFKIRYSITAQFDEGDPAYEWVVNYLTQQDVWRRSREFLVSAKSSKLKWGIKLRSTESAEYVPKYNQPHLFRWRRYWVEIQRTAKLATIQGPDNQMSSGSSLFLTMYTLNINALSELVEEAHLRYIEGRRPHVIVHSIDLMFGTSWNVVKRKNRRSLESIILPDGLLDSIVQDVKDFLQTEEWYTRAGIPYRRGYLLYGPPGTGKTSTIYALAGELGLEIYALSLSSGVFDDGMLQRAVSSLPKHSILLLEDIDCAFLTREEEEEQLEHHRNAVPTWRLMRTAQGYRSFNPHTRTTVTMSGLLNVLDGVASEDGKLFFATTNYVDRLDPALIRPGRIDKKVEYKLATQTQALALFNRIYTQELPIGSTSEPKHTDVDLEEFAKSFASRVPEDEFTTAELQGYLLSRRKSPELAVKQVQHWVEAERVERVRRREAMEKEEQKRKSRLSERGSALAGGAGPVPAKAGAWA
ncbi:hypothetical protein AX17_003788 [Amanita inopinata Kibby_2008]|nr:hypothetical protein AX17_003788 [Amanita inopinata Kibby_2008]